jgi:hypothetical protein
MIPYELLPTSELSLLTYLDSIGELRSPGELTTDSLSKLLAYRKSKSLSSSLSNLSSDLDLLDEVK